MGHMGITAIVIEGKAASGEMYILGINAYHADSSAALLRDGKLVAAAEEDGRELPAFHRRRAPLRRLLTMDSAAATKRSAGALPIQKV